MDRRNFIQIGLGGIGILALPIAFSSPDVIYGLNLTGSRGKDEPLVNNEILNLLNGMNMKDVVLHLGVFQENSYSNEIGYFLNGNRVVPKDDYVLEAIEKLKVENKNVTISPSIYTSDNSWRGEIRPDNLKLWFENYERVIMHYIQLSNLAKADSFCVGTELSTMQKYSIEWNQLIRKIKQEFNGKITYCANWDAYKGIEFLEELDYLSLSAYFPLIEKGQTPDLENLIYSWKKIGKNLNEISLNKPLVFGEVGYRSIEGTAVQELDYSNKNVKENFEEQRNCFRALNYAIKNKFIPIKKAYLWVGDTNKDNYYKTGFGIINKPVENDIRIYNEGRF